MKAMSKLEVSEERAAAVAAKKKDKRRSTPSMSSSSHIANTTINSSNNNNNNNDNELVKIASYDPLSDYLEMGDESLSSSAAAGTGANATASRATMTSKTSAAQASASMTRQSQIFTKANGDNGTISVNLDLPRDIDPSKVSVVLNEKNILIRSNNERQEVLYVVQLPENTDFKALEYKVEKINLETNAPTPTNSLMQAFDAIPVEKSPSFTRITTSKS